MLGLTVGGSAATGTMDEFSDLDFVLVCRDEDQPRLLRDAPVFAAGLGPLLACFTGEHVGEPRLLIALYGPPLLHVDLKFVAERDLDVRVEDGRVLWQRDGALDRALARAEAVWPRARPAVDRGPVLGLDPLRRDEGRPRRAVRVPRHARRAAPRSCSAR